MDQDPVESSERLWVKRPMVESDYNFVAYTWLASAKFAPDPTLMGVTRDNDALKRYWIGNERVVQSLLDNCSVTVAEAETDGSKVIIGWVCHEDTSVVHYCLTRRKFTSQGVCRDLMQPFMDVAPGTVLYTSRPATRNLRIPAHFKFDPYRALNWLK